MPRGCAATRDALGGRASCFGPTAHNNQRKRVAIAAQSFKQLQAAHSRYMNIEAPPPPRVTSEAQIAPGRWVVAQVRCSDLLGAADEDREAAAMFYYGYLAAKAGIRVIDVNRIDGNVRKVMDRCAAAPNITVPQAFRQALGRRG